MSIMESKTVLDSKTHLNYCCRPKQYYDNDHQILVKTLKIVPRIIVHKKSLKVENTFETIVRITNNGLYKRHLIFTTDSDDTTVQVYPKNLTDNFLEPDKSLKMTVYIKPLEKSRINRRRHVYINSEHPNITFTIPIIIWSKGDAISLPSSITFPPTILDNFSYYEFILYNKSMNKLSFYIKSSNPNLAVHAKSCNVSKMDYVKILLKLSCKDSGIINDVIKLKFDTGNNTDIPFTHDPLQWSLYVDILYIKFETISFNREEKRVFRICNESKNDIVFQIGLNTDEEEILLEDSYPTSVMMDCHGDSMDLLQIRSRESRVGKSQYKYGYKHFKVKPECATIPANSSCTVEVLFRPIMHKDFEAVYEGIPPFVILSSLSVFWKTNIKTEKRQIFLKGFAISPTIEIVPKSIDLRQVYFGEQHCVQIKVVNIDGISDAHVDFQDIISRDTAQIIVSPKEGITLKPCQSDIFHLQFYAKVDGKFMVKLEFKVKYGGIYSIMIRGYSKHVRVKCFPEIVDLGVIPIAIPQKRLVLLMNSISVPLTVQCNIVNDGYETPLVLNTHDADGQLPITIKDPVYNMLHSIEAEKEYELNQSFSEDPEPSVMSFQSVIDENSSYNTEFEEQALNHIPEMSKNLLSHLKAIKIFDKPDMEKKVVEEALTTLLNTPYFLEMDKYKNYTQMDWNSLATEPKEIYCNNEIIHLNPNSGKVISIVVIPNVIGYQHKYVALRVCPLMPSPTNDENPDLRQIINSEHMISKLWIEYNCSLPEIVWDNVVIMEDQLYAGEWYDFEMRFENLSKIGGFFYYDIIPDSELGTMKFRNNKWKYFIEPDTKIYIPCSVKFNQLGYIILAGLIKLVGAYAGYPFHIKSEILPPKIKFSPSSIDKTLKVLESVKLHVFIDNLTPTTTWLKLKLKEEGNISLECRGAQLAPTGQGTYTTLDIFYRDPGTYKNMLYIILQFEIVEKIPITIHIKGMPIFFEPEIRLEELNIGYVLCSTAEEYLRDKPSYSKVIQVINKGLHHYRIVITRTKCSANPSCSIHPSKAKISIKSNNFIVSPLSEEYFTILTYCCEETSVYNEFRMEIIDLKDPKRIESQRFIVKVTFVLPQLSWNRRDITMKYYRTHKYKEMPQWEIIKLTNVADNYLASVSLKLTGPFKIKELFEHQFVKELEFSMMGLECKEFFIALDKNMIRNRFNTYYEGHLLCYANSRVQKSIYLKVKMYVPTLIISQPQVVLFTKNMEGSACIELVNSGDAAAEYKWKKIKEEWRYISQEDDVQQLAEIILSDIISAIDLDTISTIPDKDSELNLSLCYRKQKCFRKYLNDPIDVNAVIYEIIENLDLMGRRYKLDYQDIKTPDEIPVKLKMDECLNFKDPQDTQDLFNRNSAIDMQFYKRENLETSFAKETSSSEICIHNTMDHILNHLKLDDSYNISEPSSETCERKNSVYFLEKYGILEEKRREMCTLHIPPVKKGFEVCAVFQLDVVGGKSQQFRITLVNLDKSLKLSNSDIYLGVMPWYEQYNIKVCAENITNYQIILNIKTPSESKGNISKIANGYVKLLTEKELQLSALQKCFIKTEGIMGFSEEFNREILITINNGEEMTIRLKGQGIMPILAIANQKLPFIEQDISEIIEEYSLLQKVYYFEIFRAITEKDDDDLSLAYEKEDHFEEDIKLKTNISLLSFSKSNTDSEQTVSSRVSEMELILQTFIFINNNNEELPNRMLLEQFLETEKFLNFLKFNAETSSLLNAVYHDYKRLQKSNADRVTVNIKYFTIQPLPFQLKSNILEIDKLVMSEYTKLIINLEFTGPGQLVASARTAIKIPGLMIDFQINENTNSKEKIMYHHSDTKQSNFIDKPYRNMYERQMDAENDPKIEHAHSYDVNQQYQHQRLITTKDRKCLRKCYNSLNKSIYSERQDHFVHCKIITNDKSNISGRNLNVIILLRPDKEYYERDQNIEDYLYIDLHMGPTLPILLRGTVTTRD